MDAAVLAVADQFAIDRKWLNPGPTDLLDHGLPDGFEERWIGANYGNALVVHFAGRIDQICFKTYAAADSAGRHLTDLIVLAPTSAEMEFAVNWVRTQDDSEGFGSQLTELLDYLKEKRADGTL